MIEQAAKHEYLKGIIKNKQEQIDHKDITYVENIL